MFDISIRRRRHRCRRRRERRGWRGAGGGRRGGTLLGLGWWDGEVGKNSCVDGAWVGAASSRVAWE